MAPRIVSLLALMIAATSCAADGIPEDINDIDNDENVGVAEQKLALADYSASNTNNALDVNNTAKFPFVIKANETVMIGTEGITDAAYVGDTFLRLRNPSNIDVASNDDSACGQNYGSRLTYTSTYGADTTFVIWAGCYSSGSCGNNTIAISRRKGTFSFASSNTNNALIGTTNKQYYYNAGDTIQVSTCNALTTGASATGDTYLRLYQNNAGVYTQVASNDNATYCSSYCGTASQITYFVPSSGYYQIRAGCNGNTSCSGTVAAYAE